MNNLIETAISLILIFFIFSTVTSIINELIAVNLQYRGRMLWKSMAQLFDGYVLKGRGGVITGKSATASTPLTDSFYNHGQIKSLSKDLQRLPHYVPAANFALVVIDLIAKSAPGGRSADLLQDFKKGLGAFVNSNGSIYEALQTIADTSADIKDLQAKIEKWFNDYMDRVTGWYKSHTLVTLRLVAIGVVLIFNLDAIRMAKTIYNNSDLREGLVTMAENVVDNSQTTAAYTSAGFNVRVAIVDSIFSTYLAEATSKKDSLEIWGRKADSLDMLAGDYTKQQIKVARSYLYQLDSVGLPLGWQCKPHDSTTQKSGTTVNGTGTKKKKDAGEWLLACFLVLAGWFISMGAISMGAPFWFDILAKVVNVRRSGLKPKS